MISVIIPAYNRETTIERAMRSVLEQTYQDLELIVVDDCSTDSTADVIKAIVDSRVRYIRHNFNQGACAARNTGIENANGEFIAFQDSDDSWRTDKLEKQMSLMQSLDADICFCRMDRHNYMADQLEFYPDLETGVVEYGQLIMQSLASTQTILAKKNIFDQFKFDPSVKRMQDYDWIIRAGEKNKVVFVKDAIVDTYLQEDSLTMNGYENILNSYETFLSKYVYLFDRYPQFHPMLLNNIGKYKTILGKNGSEEYKELYEIEKSLRAFTKWKLSQLGMLRLFF